MTAAKLELTLAHELDLANAYRQMTLIRLFEETLLELRRDGEVIGPVHPYIGQEAIAVGVCQALAGRDAIVSHYRGHGHAIARGVNVGALTAELFGKATGLCGGKAAALVSDPSCNLLLSTGLVGSGVTIAAGAALASQVRGDGSVAVVFFGDGALGNGSVHEALNMAVTQRLPVVLVCEHNGYQHGNRTEEVFPDTSLLRVPQGHLMRSVSIDGNDVAAVYGATTDAVAAARAGKGPTFVEARTYLTKFHLQFEKPSPERRPPEELADWVRRDPLALLRARMAAAGLGPAWFRESDLAARRVIDEAVTAARKAPWPAEEQAFTHVWAVGEA